MSATASAVFYILTRPGALSMDRLLGPELSAAAPVGDRLDDLDLFALLFDQVADEASPS